MGWKAKKIDIFRLKHRNLRPICMCLGCHSHGFAALKHSYCSQSQCYWTKNMCQKGLKGSQFLATQWHTANYKTTSYFPYLQQAGMLFANTPKVKRCLSRKRTIEILLWVWAFWFNMMKQLRYRRGEIAGGTWWITPLRLAHLLMCPHRNILLPATKKNAIELLIKFNGNTCEQTS